MGEAEEQPAKRTLPADQLVGLPWVEEEHGNLGSRDRAVQLGDQSLTSFSNWSRWCLCS